MSYGSNYGLVIVWVDYKLLDDGYRSLYMKWFIHESHICKPSFHFSFTNGLLIQLLNARDLWENLLRHPQDSTEKWGPHLCEAADIIVLLSFSLLFVVVLLLLLLLFALWWLYRSYWKSQIISRGSLSLGCLWKTGRETEQKENRSVWKIRSRKLQRLEEDNDVKSRCIQVRRKPLCSTRIHEWKIWTASFKVKHVGCKRCFQTEFSICTRVKSISLRCFINFHKSQCWS